MILFDAQIFICTVNPFTMLKRRWRTALTSWKVHYGKLWHTRRRWCLGLELRRPRGFKRLPASSAPTGTNWTNSTKTDSSKDSDGGGFHVGVSNSMCRDFIKCWLTVCIQQGVGRIATASGRSLFQIRRWWRSGCLTQRALWNWARVSQQRTGSTSG